MTSHSHFNGAQCSLGQVLIIYSMTSHSHFNGDQCCLGQVLIKLESYIAWLPAKLSKF